LTKVREIFILTAKDAKDGAKNTKSKYFFGILKILLTFAPTNQIFLLKKAV
jgi:hypothetical protein